MLSSTIKFNISINPLTILQDQIQRKTNYDKTKLLFLPSLKVDRKKIILQRMTPRDLTKTKTFITLIITRQWINLYS